MSDKTGIAWTDATWNPVTGCTQISPGCAHCYAKALSERFGRSFEVTLHPERLDEPLHWRKPRRVFVCSMADLFHEKVPWSFTARVFAVMALAPRHTFQVLTKRPDEMRDWFEQGGGGYYEPSWDVLDTVYSAASSVPGDTREPFPWPLPNVWLGTSIENDRWTSRADVLRDTPAAVRFISAEPLLGPLPSLDLTGIDWLIIGGESGPHARAMDPAWVRDLIDRAHAAGTAVFVKQMGGLRPGGPIPDDLNIREWPPSDSGEAQL